MSTGVPGIVSSAGSQIGTQDNNHTPPNQPNQQNQPGFNARATTPAGGTSLINNTQTLCSYAIPGSSGQVPILFTANKIVTGAETGGQINAAGTCGGQAFSDLILPGAQGVGFAGLGSFSVNCDAGTTVSITQSSALTAGASKVIASIVA